MATVLAKVERPCAIRQTMTATNDFNGAAPTAGAPTFEDDIFKHATGVAGGLFDPTNAYYAFEPLDALDLIGVELELADQTSWSVTRTDVDGGSVVLFSGTIETSFVTTEETKIVLLWGSTITLVTTGATTAMTATLKFKPHKK